MHCAQQFKFIDRGYKSSDPICIYSVVKMLDKMNIVQFVKMLVKLGYSFVGNQTLCAPCASKLIVSRAHKLIPKIKVNRYAKNFLIAQFIYHFYDYEARVSLSLHVSNQRQHKMEYKPLLATFGPFYNIYIYIYIYYIQHAHRVLFRMNEPSKRIEF